MLKIRLEKTIELCLAQIKEPVKVCFVIEELDEPMVSVFPDLKIKNYYYIHLSQEFIDKFKDERIFHFSLAHEMGHIKYHDSNILHGFLRFIHLFFLFFCLITIFINIYLSFIFFILSPVFFILKNKIFQYEEFRADRFAKSIVGEEVASFSLETFYLYDKEHQDKNQFIKSLIYEHPLTEQRLQKITKK